MDLRIILSENRFRFSGLGGREFSQPGSVTGHGVDLEIADTIHGVAFFYWANRLMLSLGEPTPAK
ncbi:hypothetical protein JOH51_003937 [Rhizobium leguminosarum]|nr:hypothetical protein [Rhizobium leguminosarum]